MDSSPAFERDSSPTAAVALLFAALGTLAGTFLVRLGRPTVDAR